MTQCCACLLILAFAAKPLRCSIWPCEKVALGLPLSKHAIKIHKHSFSCIIQKCGFTPIIPNYFAIYSEKRLALN